MVTVATPYDTPSTHQEEASRWSDALSQVASLLVRPAVAYPLLALVQLRVLWGDWLHRDLENGDNLVYVQGALRWAELGAVDLVWSPLYAMYYGTVIAIVGDAADATWLQRALMIWTVTLLVLAVLRLLLPASIAWLIAAWWATLESAHDVAVEVHLFAMVPFLAAAVLAPQGRLGRTMALGVLLTSALLVRNEYAVAAALFGAACVWWEVSRRHMAGPLVYAGAVVAVGLLVVWMDARANEPIAKLLKPESNLSWKHTANFCQAYAASYVQRHTDWPGDVFLGCNTLMERDFGVTAPTLRQSPTYGQALLANPLAILEHVAWTLSLTGNGLQLALFGAMSGTVSPEFSFISVKRDELLVPILSALLVGVTGAGAIMAFLRARACPDEMLKTVQNISWPLVVLLCGVATSLFVIAAVRPRPEYIYPLTLFVMLLAGGGLALIAARLPCWLTALLCIVTVVTVLAFVPRFYDDPAHVKPRAALARYETLKPYADLIRDGKTAFLMGEHAAGLTAYYGRQLFTMGVVYRYGQILDQYDGAEPLDRYLNDRQISLAFLDRTVMARLRQYPAATALLDDPETVGWHIVAQGVEGENLWLLIGQ